MITAAVVPCACAGSVEAYEILISSRAFRQILLARIGVDTAEKEPLEVTDSAAGENTELVVNRLLKADLAQKRELTPLHRRVEEEEIPRRQDVPGCSCAQKAACATKCWRAPSARATVNGETNDTLKVSFSAFFFLPNFQFVIWMIAITISDSLTIIKKTSS